jgi:hypothetical protein
VPENILPCQTRRRFPLCAGGVLEEYTAPLTAGESPTISVPLSSPPVSLALDSAGDVFVLMSKFNATHTGVPSSVAQFTAPVTNASTPVTVSYPASDLSQLVLGPASLHVSL